MVNKTLSKFCKISKYIEQNDKDLFQVFEDICLGHLLRPARGSNGVTFLYPKEKSYRTKIINAAYSPNPEVAIDMIKALCLKDFYPNTAAFKGTVVNGLNQKLEISEVSEKQVKLAGGLELTFDNKFQTMGNRDNMAVYTLSGKGEMSTKGEVVAVQKTGGSLFTFTSSCVSEKNALQNHLEKTYSDELVEKVDSNVYVKKVWLQLNYIIQSESYNKEALINYLGNDEFTDSYLLDIYCVKAHPNSFKAIHEHLTSFACADKRKEITRAKYIEMRATVLGSPKVGSAQPPSNAHLADIGSPMEIRKKVFDLYGDDKQRLAKDLFIVYCNISRDLWNTDSKPVDQFKNFAYIAQKIYDNLDKILNQEFDVARDLTLYGNLLKSDVLLFEPKASYELSPLAALPSPLKMSTYSLCAFINKPISINGGADCDLYLFKDL